MAKPLRSALTPLLKADGAELEVRPAGHLCRVTVGVPAEAEDQPGRQATILQLGMVVEDALLERGYRLAPREWADPVDDAAEQPADNYWARQRHRTPHSMFWSETPLRVNMHWHVRCPVDDIPPRHAAADAAALRCLIHAMFRGPMTKMEVSREVARLEGRPEPKGAPSSSRFLDDTSQWVDALWVRRTAWGRSLTLPTGTRVSKGCAYFELMPLPLVAPLVVRLGLYGDEDHFHTKLGLLAPAKEGR